MNTIECSNVISALNRIKSTCKDQGLDDTGSPLILFNNNQIIANGQSRYISINMDHQLTDCLLSFDNLHQTLSKLHLDSKIGLSLVDQSVVIKQHTGKYGVKGKRVKITLPIVSDDSQFLYIKDQPDIHEMIPLPDEFSHALKACENSLPKDTSRPEYECYNINSDEVITSDGARLSVYKLGDPMALPFMISIKDGLSIKDNQFTHYKFSDSDNYIDLVGKDIFSRISFFNNDKFPNIRNLEFETDGDTVIDRSTLINDLSSSTLFSKGSHTASMSINFEVYKEEKRYVIRSENEMGKIIAQGKALSTISFKASINPIFLLQAIEQLNRKHVTINIYNLETPGSFRFMIQEGNFTFIFSSYVVR